MIKTTNATIILLLMVLFSYGQTKLYFPKKNFENKTELEKVIIKYSSQFSKEYENAKLDRDSISKKVDIEILNQKYIQALNSINEFRKVLAPNNWNGNSFLKQEIFAKAKILSIKNKIELDNAVDLIIKNRLKNSSKNLLASINYQLLSDEDIKENNLKFEKNIDKIENDSIKKSDFFSLVNEYSKNYISKVVEKKLSFMVNKFDTDNFIIEEKLLKIKSGVQLEILICRKKSQKLKLPVILLNNIYADKNNIVDAKKSAFNGYVGVILATRGKKKSLDKNEPFEHEAQDIYEVIDWISKQSWCNGSVGMMGGSYLGFSQWAATKKLHPSLKTIVPQVAVGIGIDYPMANNVFMSYMQQWLCFVTNNNMTDKQDFNDSEKWNNIWSKWYKSGLSFRKLDSISGKKSEIFQRWLDHPSYDNYWKKMIPYKEDFSKINIPILSTTGYYDDDQRGALYYFNEHNKYNPNANHYLVIGPYDHGSAQSFAGNELYGYKLNEVAKVNINDLAYLWFDYILKRKKKPEILKNKINYQIMETNKWRHVNKMEDVNNKTLKFYLNNDKNIESVFVKPNQLKSISKEIDFKIRENDEKYFNFGKDSLYLNKNHIVIVSEALKEDLIISGEFKLNLNISINKKDLDIYAQLYHTQLNGEVFNLGGSLFRASYAKDKEKRNFLTPNEKTNIKFGNTNFVAKKIVKGSKLVIIIGVNKDAFYQINYGTGKDVSDEDINDAKEPLKIDWYNDSYIEIPLLEGFE